MGVKRFLDLFSFSGVVFPRLSIPTFTTLAKNQITIFLLSKDQIIPTKRMSVDAMCLPGILSCERVSAEQVDLVSNYLQVTRINTSTITTQVITYLLRAWDYVYSKLKNQSVYYLSISLYNMISKNSISPSFFTSLPFPARGAFEKRRVVDFNFIKDTLQRVPVKVKALKFHDFIISRNCIPCNGEV